MKPAYIGYKTSNGAWYRISDRYRPPSIDWHRIFHYLTSIFIPDIGRCDPSHDAPILRSRASIESRSRLYFLPWGSSHLRWLVEASTIAVETARSFCAGNHDDFAQTQLIWPAGSRWIRFSLQTYDRSLSLRWTHELTRIFLIVSDACRCSWRLRIVVGVHRHRHRDSRHEWAFRFRFRGFREEGFVLCTMG